MNAAQSSLLDALVVTGKLDKETASKIQLEQISANIPLEKFLLERKFVSSQEFFTAKASLLGVTYISITEKGIPQELLELVPVQVAKEYKLIPFELDQKKNLLHVAMVDPLDYGARQFVEKKTGKTVKPYLAEPDELSNKIDTEYSQNIATEVTEALKETGGVAVKTVIAEKIGDIIREPPIARIVSTILEYAVRSRASDIHIEPQEARTRVRYRVDGLLQEKLILPKNVHDAVISRIKILSDMKIDERRLPQDGRFNFKLGEEETDLRVSSLPTIHGEKIVMRLLKKTGGIPDLPELGLSGLALKQLEEAMTRPYGIILVTGPTGSGKTTTLYSVLTRINKIHLNIVTLEDPVEYQITGLNQVQINPTAGLTFATGLRAFVRQDPNVILVGEIRDNETTNLAIQAALTGHLVFSTLHTNDAATAVPRLLDLGAEPFLIASVIHAVVAQRICRKICLACKEAYTPDAKTQENIKTILGPLLPANVPLKLYRGKGCSECANSGYHGRIGIYELLKISEKISKMILARTPAIDIQKQAISEGMLIMKQDGYIKALKGVTSIEEVLRVAEV
jgi:type IV pilus assembly protein PilB